MKLLQMLCVLAATAAATAPVAASEAIIKKARCVACHAVERKLVGPAYKDVAAKYQGQPDAAARLAAKVRQGGAGVWGDIPMPPNPPERLSDADLAAAIEWVLSRH